MSKITKQQITKSTRVTRKTKMEARKSKIDGALASRGLKRHDQHQPSSSSSNVNPRSPPTNLTNLTKTKTRENVPNPSTKLASKIPSLNPINLLVENWLVKVPINAEDVGNEILIEDEAEEHKLIEPPPKYACTLCDKLYRNRQEFLPHLFIVHRVKSRNEKNLDIIQAISRVTSLEIKSATGSLELTNNDDDDEEDKAARTDKETNEVPLHLEMEPKMDIQGRIICLLCETVMIPNFFCFHLVNAHNLRAYRDLNKCIQMYTVKDNTKNAAERTNHPIIKSEPCECSELDLNNLRNVERQRDHNHQREEEIPKKSATCSKLAIKQEPTDCETEVAPTLIPKMEKTHEKDSQVGNHNCLADHDYRIATTFVEPKRGGNAILILKAAETYILSPFFITMHIIYVMYSN